MNRTTLTASLLLLSGAVFLAPTSALAQNGGKGKRTDRQNQILPGRIARATLKSMAFGDNATLTVTTDDGEELTLKWTNAQFHKDGAPTTPSTFAVKNPAGSPVAILFAQSQGTYTLREIWDLASWNAELNKHKGVQTGGISSLNNRVIAFGELRYALSKDTLWVKGGQRASREDFSVRQTVFVKGDTASGVPMALTVADTAEGANSNALDLWSGLTDGIKPKAKPGKRPKSTGTGNGDGTSPTEESRQNTVSSLPPSTRTPYTLRVFFKILDGNDVNDLLPDAAKDVLNKVGASDKTVECYGEVFVNAESVWEITRDDAERFKKKVGQTIAVVPTAASGFRNGSLWRVSDSKIAIGCNLFDRDVTNQDDRLFDNGPTYLFLDLSALAGKGEKVYTSVNGKAELHITVTR